jgi:uncharacterized protein YozE (UPF0346 family)
MKRRLWPIGYKYSIANTIGGLICILSPFLFLIIVNHIGYPIDISTWLKAAMPIVGVGIILIIIELIEIEKVRKLRKQREVMMKQYTHVIGKIKEIKRFHLDSRGRERNTFEKGSMNVYQLVVNYFDPSDNKNKTAISNEYYRENLFVCLADDYVDVYIVGDHEYALIDGLHIRKIKGEKINIENDKCGYCYSDIEFYMDIYGGVIVPILGVIGVILAGVFFSFFTSLLRR